VPVEVIAIVVSFGEPRDIGRLCLTSKKVNDAMTQEDTSLDVERRIVINRHLVFVRFPLLTSEIAAAFAFTAEIPRASPLPKLAAILDRYLLTIGEGCIDAWIKGQMQVRVSGSLPPCVNHIGLWPLYERLIRSEPKDREAIAQDFLQSALGPPKADWRTVLAVLREDMEKTGTGILPIEDRVREAIGIEARKFIAKMEQLVKES
jgi:hypothetical protein